ncbi:GNAT family N-acetyltransferase [Luteolibacter soli]|uniref:GNAT family N-acetyltransferase n=1 Tax=Luteolibacter soli TaxID=3135280 RepID=A0ABU9AUA5_9BACT
MATGAPLIDQVILRSLRDDDSIPEITRLLHAAYAPLAAMGLRYTATHQSDETTLSRLQRGVPFIGELNGEIIATVTLYPTAGENSSCAWYREPGVFYFGQFGVSPRLQGHGLGLRMMEMLEKESVARGGRELALDTAEQAHHLIQWYEKIGYRFIQYADWSTTNYRSVILSKSLVP